MVISFFHISSLFIFFSHFIFLSNSLSWRTEKILSACYFPESDVPTNSSGMPVKVPLPVLKMEECHTVSYVPYGSGYQVDVTLVLYFRPNSMLPAYNITINSTIVDDFKAQVIGSSVAGPADVSPVLFSLSPFVLICPYFPVSSDSINVTLSLSVIPNIVPDVFVSTVFNLSYFPNSNDITDNPHNTFRTSIASTERYFFPTNEPPIIRGPARVQTVQYEWSPVPIRMSDSSPERSPTWDFFYRVEISSNCFVKIPFEHAIGISLHPFNGKMPSTEYNLRYDIGPDYNLNFSTASGDLSNLLVQCIDGSGTFNITVFDNGHGGIGGERYASESIPLVMTLRTAAPITLYMPPYIRIFFHANTTLSSLFFVDPISRSDQMTLKVSCYNALLVIPGSTSCQPTLPDYTYTYISCLSITNTLSELNSTFSTITVEPLQDHRSAITGVILELSSSSYYSKDELYIIADPVNRYARITYGSAWVEGLESSGVMQTVFLDQNKETIISGIKVSDIDLLDQFFVILKAENSSGLLLLNSTMGCSIVFPEQYISYLYTSLVSAAATGSEEIRLFGDQQALSFCITAGIVFSPFASFWGNSSLSISVFEGFEWTNSSVPLVINPIPQPPVLKGPLFDALPLILLEDSIIYISFSLAPPPGTLFDLYNITIYSTFGWFSFSNYSIGYNTTFSNFFATLSDANSYLNVSFTPFNDYYGLDAYLVVNISCQDVATWGTYTFNVVPVNDEPRIIIGEKSVNTTGILWFGDSLLISDVDSDFLRIKLWVLNGTLSINLNALSPVIPFYTLEVYPGSNQGEKVWKNATLDFRVDEKILNTVLETLNYYPAPGKFNDVLFVQADDEMGGVSLASSIISFVLVDQPIVIQTPYRFDAMEDTFMLWTGFIIRSIDPLISNTTLVLTVLYGSFGYNYTGTQVVTSEHMITFVGSIEQINSALQQSWYLAPLDFNFACCGAENVTITATYNSSNLVEFVTKKIVTIQVAAVNDAPVIFSERLLVNEGSEMRLNHITIYDVDRSEVFTNYVTLNFTVLNGLLRAYLVGSCAIAYGTDPFLYQSYRSSSDIDTFVGEPFSAGTINVLGQIPSTIGDKTVVVNCRSDDIPYFLSNLGYLPKPGSVANESLSIIAIDNGYGIGGPQMTSVTLTIEIVSLGLIPPNIGFVSNHSYIFLGEDGCTEVNINFLVSDASPVSEYYLDIIVQNGMVAFVNSTSEFSSVVIGNRSVNYVPPYSPDTLDFHVTTPSPNYRSSAFYSVLSLVIFNSTNSELKFLYTPVPNWNSVGNGPDIIFAYASSTPFPKNIYYNATYMYDELPYTSTDNLNIVVLALNDAPVINAPDPVSTFESVPIYFAEFGDRTPSSFLIYDLDLTESPFGDVLYFELFSHSMDSIIKFNTTDGLMYLSNTSVAYINPESLDTNLTAPITDEDVVTNWIFVGSTYFSGFADAASLTRALRGLTFTTGLHVRDYDLLELRISDRGRTSTCVDATPIKSSLANPLNLADVMAFTADVLALYGDIFPADSNVPIDGGRLFNTTDDCAGNTWLWSNKTVLINITMINEIPSLQLLLLNDSDHILNSVAPAYAILEDYYFVLPPIVLRDRENDICPYYITGYAQNFTFNVHASNGVLFVSSSSNATGNGTNLVRAFCLYPCYDLLQNITFLPNKDYNGLEANVVVSVTDDPCPVFTGGPKTFHLQIYFDIEAVNDAPVLDGLLQSYALFQNSEITIESITASDVDIMETYGSMYFMTLEVSHGNLSFAKLNLWNYPPGIHLDTEKVASFLSFNANPENLPDRLLQGITYTPAKHFCGVDVLTIFLSDMGNSGLSQSESLNVSISTELIVTCIDTPLTIFVPQNWSGLEDSAFLLSGISLTSIDTIQVQVTFEISVETGVFNFLFNFVWKGFLWVDNRAFLTFPSLVIGNNNTQLISVRGNYSEIVSILLQGIGYNAPLNWNGVDILKFAIWYPSQTGRGDNVTTLATSAALIYIVGVNDAPILYLASSYIIPSSFVYLVHPNATLVRDALELSASPLSTTIYLQNLIKIADVDIDDRLAFGEGMMQLNISVHHGHFLLKTIAGLAVLAGSWDDGSVLVEGYIDHLNEALSELVYIPNEGFYGNDTISFIVSDLGFTGGSDPNDYPPKPLLYSDNRGPALYDTIRIFVSVYYVNSPPIIPIYEHVFAFEDTPTLFTSFTFSQYLHPPQITGYNVSLSVRNGVLKNSFIEDGLWQNNGVVVYSNGSSGIVEAGGTNLTTLFSILSNIIYFPKINFNGFDHALLTVTDISDGSSSNSTFDIWITAINDAPVLTFVSANLSQFRNTSIYSTHSSPTRIPLMGLIDIDAENSSIPMSLIITAQKGGVALDTAFSYVYNEANSLFASSYSSTLAVSGSREILSVYLMNVMYLLTEGLFPAVDNDFVTVFVSDNGATGDLKSHLNTSLYINISVVASFEVPKFYSFVNNPIDIDEDNAIQLNNLFSLNSIDLPSNDSEILRVTFHFSVDAISAGIKVVFDNSCPSYSILSFDSASHELSSSVDSILESASASSAVDFSIQNKVDLLSSRSIQFFNSSLNQMNKCLSNITILPGSEFAGILYEAITIYVERLDVPFLPNSAQFSSIFKPSYPYRSNFVDLYYHEVNDAPEINPINATLTLRQGTSVPIPKFTVSDLDFSYVRMPQALRDIDIMMDVSIDCNNGTISLFGFSNLNFIVPDPVISQSFNRDGVLKQKSFRFKAPLLAVNDALSSLIYNAPNFTGDGICGEDTVVINVNDIGFFGSGGILSAESRVYVKFTC